MQEQMRSVLVVEQFDETGEVLEAVFRPRGVRVLHARRFDRGLQLAREHRPDVVVVDADDQREGDDHETTLAPYQNDSAVGASRMVVIGSSPRRSDGCEGGAYLAKPYQYGPLVRRIEEMLSRL